MTPRDLLEFFGEARCMDPDTLAKRTRIVVDQVRARRAGISSSDVASWLQTQLDGLEITQYREDDIAIPVIARSIEEHRTSAHLGNCLTATDVCDERHDPVDPLAAQRFGHQFLVVLLSHQARLGPAPAASRG